MKKLNDRGQVTTVQIKHKYAQVAIPEWDCEVTLRSLTSGDREEIDDSRVMKADGTFDMRELRANYIIRSVVSESGAYVFTQNDIDWLQSQPENVIALLFVEIQKLNGNASKN